MPDPSKRITGKLSEEERAALLQETVAALHRFEQGFDHFTDRDWLARPKDGGWSAAEIAEHVLLVNDRLLSAVMSRQSADISPGWSQGTQGKEEWIRTVLPSQGKAKASALLSTFTGVSREQGKASLLDFLRRFEHFLTQAEDLPLHAITWPHPFLGELSAYQWLLYIPFHTQRHQGQLQRLSAAAED